MWDDNAESGGRTPLFLVISNTVVINYDIQNIYRMLRYVYGGFGVVGGCMEGVIIDEF